MLKSNFVFDTRVNLPGMDLNAVNETDLPRQGKRMKKRHDFLKKTDDAKKGFQQTTENLFLLWRE